MSLSLWRKRPNQRRCRQLLKGEKRSNETHRSTTDPEARLYKKSDGQPARLLSRIELPAAWRVIVVLDARARGLSGEQERSAIAQLPPLPQGAAFYLVALGLGPILGSFITEPAAMTLIALILRQRLYSRDVSPRFAYATLGLLLVNVSVGGVLTHFAAPPVLMVAGKWNWGLGYMFTHFGWRGLLTTLSGAVLMIACAQPGIPLKGNMKPDNRMDGRK